MQQVLVTGGAGFIGSRTVDVLLAQGVRVRVLDNLSNGRWDRLNTAARATGQLTLIEGDVHDPLAVNAAVEGCDAVLHLAAKVPVKHSPTESMASPWHNVIGFLNVIDAVRRYRVPRLVYVSSAAVYGAPESLQPARPRPVYGLEKFIIEQYAALYRTLHGVSSVGMCYCNVHGPRNGPRTSCAARIEGVGSSVDGGDPMRVLNDASRIRGSVDVGDVAHANVRALTSGVQGVLNIGVGPSLSLQQLMDVVRVAFGKAPKLHHEPVASMNESRRVAVLLRIAQVLAWRPTTPLLQGLKALAASLRRA